MSGYIFIPQEYSRWLGGDLSIVEVIFEETLYNGYIHRNVQSGTIRVMVGRDLSTYIADCFPLPSTLGVHILSNSRINLFEVE